MPGLLPIPNPVSGVINAVGDAAADKFKDMIVSLANIVIEGAAWVFGQLIDRINSSTTPDLEAGWYKNGPFAKMLFVATFLTAIMVILGICQGVASGDPGAVLRRVIVQLPGAVLGITVVVGLTVFGLKLTDALSNELLQGTAGPVKDFVKTMTARSAKTAPIGPTPAGVMGLSALVMLLGSLVVWAELLVRSALIYLLVALAPVAIAARVWGVTREISHRVLHYLAGFVLAKLIVALCLSIGLAALSNGHPAGTDAPAPPGMSAAPASPGSGATPQDAQDLGTILMGAALVGLAAFAPFTAIKLMPIAENATHQQGVKGGPGRAMMTGVGIGMAAKGAIGKGG